MRWIRRRAAPPFVCGFESWASRRGSCGWWRRVNVMTMDRFVGDIFVKWEFATSKCISTMYKTNVGWGRGCWDQRRGL